MAVIKRGSNKYEITWEVGTDGTTGRKRKTLTITGTKKEAEAKLREILTSRDTGNYVEPNKLTVTAWMETWLTDIAPRKAGARTLESYRQRVESHVLPYIGTLPLAKLQPEQISKLYNDLLSQGNRRSGGSLSATTVLCVHQALSSALDAARKFRKIPYNPAEDVDPPSAKIPEMQTLDQEGVQQLLAAAYDTKLYLPILIAITAGMRRQEILALRWSDINLDRRRLTVNQALEQTIEFGVRAKEPKTERSRRAIAIPPVLVDALRAHRTRERRIAGLLFCSEDGAPWKPTLFSCWFGRFLIKHDLPRIRFHDLRHSHCTLALEGGVPLFTVSRRLGHSSTDMVSKRYGHLTDDMQDQAAAVIETIVRGDAGLRKEGTDD